MTTKNADTLEKAEAEAQSEIDQILDEVEDLRRELTDGESGETETEARDPAAPEAAAPDPDDEDLMKEFHAAFEKAEEPTEDEGGMEETLGGLKHDAEAGLGPISEDEDMSKSLLDQTFEHQESRGADKPLRVVANEGGEASGPGTLTMTLKGDMELKLNYEFEGQEVTIGFVDSCLKISLSDGTEFKIPVARQRALRRAG